MTIFVDVSLYMFAGFAVLGMAFPFLISAKTRKPHLAGLAFVIAAWVVTVCVAAAVKM